MTTLTDWLTVSPPSWAEDTILNFEDIYRRAGGVDMINFVTSETFEFRTDLDMREVVGQWDHYAGHTWLGAALDPQISPGKMKSVFREYEENPNYYFNGEINGGISVSSINGGAWYSDNSGNHRTVVAKFASEQTFQETGNYPLVKGVTKHSYYVDLDAWKHYVELTKFADNGIHISVRREQVSNVPNSESQTIRYKVEFFVGDYRFNDQGRSGWLNPSEFIKHAQSLIKTNAVPTDLEKFKHYWGWWFGDRDGLILMQ
jgi:hypothetical protein